MKPQRMSTRVKEGYTDDRGITGLETAIILIAFIVVAAVFAFTVMTTGLFSTEKAKTTAQAGIAEASSTFAPKGAIVAKADATKAHVERVFMQLTLATGATNASIAKKDLAFIYTDDNQRHSIKASITSGGKTGIIDQVIVKKIVGDTSVADLLREGEVAEIEVVLNDGTDCGGCEKLEANKQFRIEIIPPAGGSLIIARKTPPGLTKVMNLE